jgi:hypothetical protein
MSNKTWRVMRLEVDASGRINSYRVASNLFNESAAQETIDRLAEFVDLSQYTFVYEPDTKGEENVE